MISFLNKRPKIVYSPSTPLFPIEHEAAFWLRQQLATEFEMELEVIASESATGEPAILLGEISKLCPAKNQYMLKQADENTLCICAGATAAYDDLITYFLQLAKENQSLPTELVCKEASDKSLCKRYGDLRILFHNIFGYDRKPTINPQRRYTFESILYKEYDADILCLQEYDGGPRKYLGPLLEEVGFCEVPVDQLGFPKNCSPIFYRKDRVRVLDHGFFPFTYKSAINEMVCNNHDTKNLTWAVFEENKTHKRFVVISVHFYYSPDASSDMTNRVESNKARMENAREMFSVIQNNIYTKNGGAYASLPILWGGDLNCSYQNKELPSLIESANGKIALDVLEEELGMKHVQKHATLFADSIGAYCGYPTYNEELGYYNACGTLTNKTFDTSIDHAYIFGEGVTPLTFDILDTTYAKKTSDHTPIVVDYRLD